MQQMLKQVQKMQADMAEAQEELKDEVVEASAGGGDGDRRGDRRARLQVDQDRRPRRSTPTTSRCSGHGAGRRQRGLRAAQELAAQKLRRHAGGLGGPGGLGGLGLPGF